MYAELKQREGMIDYKQSGQPCGCGEFGIKDFNGYDIAFGREL